MRDARGAPAMMMPFPRPIRRLLCLVLGHQPWITIAGYRSLQCRCCGELAFPPAAGDRSPWNPATGTRSAESAPDVRAGDVCNDAATDGGGYGETATPTSDG